MMTYGKVACFTKLLCPILTHTLITEQLNVILTDTMKHETLERKAV